MRRSFVTFLVASLVLGAACLTAAAYDSLSFPATHLPPVPPEEDTSSPELAVGGR